MSRSAAYAGPLVAGLLISLLAALAVLYAQQRPSPWQLTGSLDRPLQPGWLGGRGGGGNTSATGGWGKHPLVDAYLDTVRDALTGALLETPHLVDSNTNTTAPFDAELRHVGKDFPIYGYTMTGTLRMNTLRRLLEDVLARGVPGDFVECGVWRGGSSIFAKAVLRAYGDSEREVHLVDSFQGLPPNTTARDSSDWSRMDFLRVSLDQVRANFQRFGLLDSQVQFHRGFFRYSLPAWRGSPGGGRPIALARLDGDMYESTVDELYNLWDGVSEGGWVIVDDYCIPECRAAVHEFLERHAISARIIKIDWCGVYFQKPPGSPQPIDASWYAAFNSSRTLENAAVAGAGTGSGSG